MINSDHLCYHDLHIYDLKEAVIKNPKCKGPLINLELNSVPTHFLYIP